MARHRRPWAVAVVLALGVGAACADPDAGRPGSPAPTPTSQTTVTIPATPTTGSATVADAPTATQPLTTVSPSPLLDELTAAYRSAYDDLLVAESIPDPEHPALDEHIAGRQLAAWQRVIGQLVRRGQRVRVAEQRWSRIERLTGVDADTVDLVVCRFDPDDTVGPDGQVVERVARPHRFIERFDLTDGEWTWTARTWLDDGPHSDCAWPG